MTPVKTEPADTAKAPNPSLPQLPSLTSANDGKKDAPVVATLKHEGEKEPSKSAKKV